VLAIVDRLAVERRRADRVVRRQVGGHPVAARPAAEQRVDVVVARTDRVTAGTAGEAVRAGAADQRIAEPAAGQRVQARPPLSVTWTVVIVLALSVSSRSLPR
jgi:hypothetical protein